MLQFNLFFHGLNDIGTTAHMCARSTLGSTYFTLVFCLSSSSPERYKTESQPFSGGLEVISRLKPVTFKWRQDGKSDVGLNADDVAEVAPLLVSRNEKGEVEDVKEGGLTALFINAFKQQQSQITEQRQEIDALKKRHQEIDALKAIVCADHPTAAVCKSN